MSSQVTREALWSTITTIVLIARFLATIATVLLALLWLVAAVRHTLLNGWLWWALGAALIWLVTTYLYSVLRVRYPSGSERWEP